MDSMVNCVKPWQIGHLGMSYSFLTDKKGKVSAKFCQFAPAIGLPFLDSANRRVKYYAKFAISNYVIKLKFIDYKRGKEVD